MQTMSVLNESKMYARTSKLQANVKNMVLNAIIFRGQSTHNEMIYVITRNSVGASKKKKKNQNSLTLGNIFKLLTI